MVLHLILHYQLHLLWEMSVLNILFHFILSVAFVKSAPTTYRLTLCRFLVANSVISFVNRILRIVCRQLIVIILKGLEGEEVDSNTSKLMHYVK